MKGFEIVSQKPKVKKKFDSVAFSNNFSIVSPVMSGFATDTADNTLKIQPKSRVASTFTDYTVG